MADTRQRNEERIRSIGGPAPVVYRVRFSTRGRVTIPVALRRKFGLKGGSRVTFKTTPTGIMIIPARQGRR
jgi:AbrB family looped-hinge helix DNA binding protein